MKKILILLSLMFVGCGGPPPPEKPFLEGGYEQHHPNTLPTGATLVKDLGNGWVIFHIEIFEEKRYFMHRTRGDYSGDGQWSDQSITEIKPPRGERE